jgi:hypothetical protein
MTSELTFYQAFGVKGPEGQYFPLVGSIGEGKTIDVADTPHDPGTLIELAAGETKLLYDHEQNGVDWDCLALYMEEGFLYLAILIDLPVSDTDLGPAGSINRAHPIGGLSCKCWQTWTSPLVKTNATLNTDVGLSGDLPTCLTSVSSEQGRIYHVWGQNASADTPAKVRRFLK